MQTERANFSWSPAVENSKRIKEAVVSCLRDNNSTKYFDFAIIGSGVAGLRYALEVAKHGSVAVITKAEPHESNTNYAQGGVSAVLCPLDSVENHMRDTIVAGAYLCDEETVKVSFQFPWFCFELFTGKLRKIRKSNFNVNMLLNIYEQSYEIRSS